MQPTTKSPTLHMSGFSLVEMIVGVFIMALVISGGLAALTQATTLSEKQGSNLSQTFYSGPKQSTYVRCIGQTLSNFRAP